MRQRSTLTTWDDRPHVLSLSGNVSFEPFATYSLTESVELNMVLSGEKSRHCDSNVALARVKVKRIHNTNAVKTSIPVLVVVNSG
jgi:hypothetical protein